MEKQWPVGDDRMRRSVKIFALTQSVLGKMYLSSLAY